MRNISLPGPPRWPTHRHDSTAGGIHWVVALASLLIAAAGHAAPQPGKDPLSSNVDFLPVDDAFVLTARRTDGELVVRWDIADGYYLYRHAFSAESADAGLGQPVIPSGEPKFDDYFGDSEVYYGRVEMTVPIDGATASAATDQSPSQRLRLHVTYQGCADYGLCYPPQRRVITFAPDGSLEIARSPARAAKADVR